MYDHNERSSFMGGMNYHIPMKFEDGVNWNARVRRSNATSPPAALRDYIIQSEVATLKFLEQTAVLAPKVHDFELEGPGNPIGVGFMIVDRMPGMNPRSQRLLILSLNIKAFRQVPALVLNGAGPKKESHCTNCGYLH